MCLAHLEIVCNSRHTLTFAGWLILLIGFWPALSLAETPSQRNFKTYQPEVTAVRIETSEAPNIDGDLSDPAWQKAAVVDEFYQLEPKEGNSASERTVVRILYDQNNLYFGIMSYDDEPDKITAKIKARDGTIENDDSIRIYLDPNMTRRNGYIFEVNPLGARLDALLQNNVDSLPTWNALWDAKARILPDGWSIEVAIPFRSVSYPRDRSDWGFDILRLVRRKNESIRWSQINKAIPLLDISHSGTLKGITNINEGLGLDVQAYSSLRYHQSDRGTGISVRPSGNAYYKITPSLTGTITYNTDFSDAPLDLRQVNISRFSLFYPERRDFFLQDAASFEFGGIPLHDDVNARPFISRSIGIVNGDPVNILVGGKVSGDYDAYGLGALIVQTAGGAGVSGQLLSVARVSEPVLDGESKIGVIFTNGDPTGATENSVAGTDFQYYDTKLLNGDALHADGFYERSFSNGVGDDDAYGFQISLPNEPWRANFRFKQVGENFSPGMGFVSRPGIREYTGDVVRRDRLSGSTFRWIEGAVLFDIVSGLDNVIQTAVYDAWADTYTNSGYAFLIEGLTDHEVTPSFTLPHNVLVPAGTYDWFVFHSHAELPLDGLISGAFDIQCCGFYGGTLLQTQETVTLTPSSTFNISVNHTMQLINLPTGHVAIHVGNLDFAVNFTPDMQVRAQVEYDNISQDLATSVRYRWEFSPGSELLIVAGNDSTFSGRLYQSHKTTLSVRLGHTFRI